MSGKPHIVIVGAGFGGLYAARALRKVNANVTLIDRKNHHTFQPLLYQVATAALNPSEIAQPIRKILRGQRNLQVVMAEVSGIDVVSRKVLVKEEVLDCCEASIHYDYLILACGATHSYFGHPEWEKWAPGLKTIEDAVELRQRFLCVFETATNAFELSTNKELLTFVIVGAGPTGVEMAGTISEVARRSLLKDFPRLHALMVKVLLLEAGPRVLSDYPEELSASAKTQLEKLGVEVRVNSPVTGIEKNSVTVGDERIPAAFIMWAAGVQAAPLGKNLEANLDSNGRVMTQPDLSITHHPEVFVVGDLAAVKDKSGELVPGVAPAAIQMGRHAARVIRLEMMGRTRPQFTYHNKGSLATIGRAAAVAWFGKLRFSGTFAWLAWLFIHLWYLIGFRRKLFVMIQWAWSYMRFEPGAELITRYGSGRSSP